MISGTVNHVKFKRLARELKLTEWECVGILESIWMFTAKSHICGDIGTSDNIDIAIGIGWLGDEDELVNALVKSKWVDECKTHRLVIHDWHMHCPNHVKGNVARHKKKFASENILPREVPKEGSTEEVPEVVSHEDAPTKPSQANPSPTKPIQDISLLPDESVRLTDKLIAHVRTINSNPKNLSAPNFDKTRYSWAEDIDKANRLDGRSWSSLSETLDFVINDDFWSGNILSGRKLREKYDTIEARLKKQTPKEPESVMTPAFKRKYGLK